MGTGVLTGTPFTKPAIYCNVRTIYGISLQNMPILSIQTKPILVPVHFEKSYANDKQYENFPELTHYALDGNFAGCVLKKRNKVLHYFFRTYLSKQVEFIDEITTRDLENHL